MPACLRASCCEQVAELTARSATLADELEASRAETAAAKDDAEAYREDLEASNVSTCAVLNCVDQGAVIALCTTT
jgi:outer membrane murein-binding lipoprotein Lpp